MKPSAFALLGSVSAAVLLFAAPAMAQDATPTARESAPEQPGDEETDVDEIVVTGTRAPGRSRLETVSPVDVISTEMLTRTGTTELAQALSTVAPSIDFPRPSITDGTDTIRPATLRGLAPDQTLVLVNSTRRHSSALVNVNGSIGRGSAAVDLNAIPTAAIERVEVLREGASAQYGSDAIAGVINLRLREAREGGSATVNVGQYMTHPETARIPQGRDETDGQTVTVSGWQGFALGAEGFLTLSAEYLDRQPTSRGDLDPRLSPRPARINSRYGDPEVKQGSVYLNAGLPISAGWEGYGWAGYQHRDAESAATPRPFNNINNDPNVYPEGFTPLIAPTVDDLTAAIGARGDIGGFGVDVNLVYGRNTIDYRVENSINATLIPNSPTSFDAGGMEYDQWVLGVDFVKPIEMGWSKPLNLAFGAETRNEGYSIHAGELASYEFRPGRPAGTGAGSQGFIGFRPSNEVDVSRSSWGVYVDVDAQLTEAFNVNAAARYENYEDFGSTTTGKIAARYDFTRAFALRGAVSTGFRAPALQQQYFTATAINFLVINGVSTPTEVTTLPPTTAVAASLGARPLQPEESVNYSAGIVFHQGPFEVTIDAYRIDIENRIVLSENLLGNPTGNATERAIYNLLNPGGVGSLGGARFFINGVDSETMGVDLVARYRLNYGDRGRFDFTLAANYNETDITRVPAIPSGVPIPNPPSLFNRINVLTFEQGTPRQKVVFSTDWDYDPWGATLKLHQYGDVTHPFSNTDPSFDVHPGDNTLVDLEGRFDLTANGRSQFAVGVNNVLDVYPDPTHPNINTNGALAFSNYSPFGFNGRFVYGRLTVGW